MFKAIAVIFLVAIVVCACGDKKSDNKDESSKDHPEAENAVIDDALKAQLEALGYVQKENEKPKVSAKNNPYENADISVYMEGIVGTFVFYDMNNNIEIVKNDERAKTRFSPCSTFKIPNSIIALDSGVAKDPQFTIPWDKKKHPKQPFWDDLIKEMGLNWEMDHTLQSAFKNSCVWYYRELANKIGEERMQWYLKSFNYGNQDISSGLDTFWLNKSMKISAKEQVDFLKRFVNKELKLGDEAHANALKVLERERKDGSILYAKTGGGKNIGWFVGFIDSGKNKYIFAFNMEGSFEEVEKKRVEISEKILRELGVWF